MDTNAIVRLTTKVDTASGARRIVLHVPGAVTLAKGMIRADQAIPTLRAAAIAASAKKFAPPRVSVIAQTSPLLSPTIALPMTRSVATQEEKKTRSCACRTTGIFLTVKKIAAINLRNGKERLCMLVE